MKEVVSAFGFINPSSFFINLNKCYKNLQKHTAAGSTPSKDTSPRRYDLKSLQKNIPILQHQTEISERHDYLTGPAYLN